jgi:hypothetical protein
MLTDKEQGFLYVYLFSAISKIAAIYSENLPKKILIKHIEVQQPK